jgi:hypothetical protein
VCELAFVVFVKIKVAVLVSALSSASVVGVASRLSIEELFVTEELVKGAASFSAKSSVTAPPVAVEVS